MRRIIVWMVATLALASTSSAGTVTLSMLFSEGTTPDVITIDQMPSSRVGTTKYLDFDINGGYANPVFADQSSIIAGQEKGTTASDGDIVAGTVFPASGNKITIDITTSTSLFTKGKYLLTLWDFPEAVGAISFCVDENAVQVDCVQDVRQK